MQARQREDQRRSWWQPGCRVRRGRSARDHQFHPGTRAVYLIPPSSVAREFFPWRDATSKTRFPGRYSADHPRSRPRHSLVSDPWNASGHESSSLAPFFFPSFAHNIPPGLISRTWKAKLEWLNGIEVKWDVRPPACTAHAHVSRLTLRGCREAGPERWFPATKRRRYRGLSWLINPSVCVTRL